MTEIPESLLRRSAEAKAKALGVPVEQVLAEMKGEAPPATPPSEPETPPAAEPETSAAPEAAAAPDVPAAGGGDVEALLEKAAEVAGMPEALLRRSAEAKAKALDVPLVTVLAEMAGEEAPAVAEAPAPEPVTSPAPAPEPSTAGAEAKEAGTAVAVQERPAGGNGQGGGQVAAVVSPRPSVPPANAPEGVRTQRLLTVVKAKAIQQVKTEPHDKVNTWPHLMLIEFVALLAMLGFVILLSVILQAPLLEAANPNLTPNPAKAPWYFLGLQELLSYFDPQIAGVTVPTIIGLIGFMMIPYVDRNPSTKPSDRKFAIMLYTIFLAGSATLTILGVLFRGRGFNFSYPWKDGVFFDDLKDWVSFE